MKSFRTIVFRLLIAIVFSLPVYFLLDQNILKYIVDYKSEHLNERNANISDIDADGFPETYYFFNISEEQVYLEMWSKGSLVGVWTAKGKLANSSMIMDQQKDKKTARLFFITEMDKQSFVNQLDLKIVNKKLVSSCKSTALVEKGEGADSELLQRKLIDLDGDGENEYVFSYAEALDIRNLVAYYPKTQKIVRSGTSFMMISDFFKMPGNPNQLLFTSYANGNVSAKNVRRMVKEYNLDTALCTDYYTDLKSYVGLLDGNLKVQEIKLQRKGFTSMYRIIPVNWNNIVFYLSLSTFVNEPDSLPQISLLDEQLKILTTQNVTLPVQQELFNKFKKDVFYVKKGTRRERDHIYVIGQNDTIYELTEELKLLPVAASKNISDKSTLEFTDLDGDGSEEIILTGSNGMIIYQNDFKDAVAIESGGLSALKKDRFSELKNGKPQWQLITDTNDHITLSYVSNTWYYWKIPFFIFSILFVFALLSFLIRMNGRKIERENKRLEQVVQERTKEVVNQKLIADHQRELVEEKQKEIIDSINYAKRIQSAIMAKETDIRVFFPESFLLYQPKDIVAGDFYFFESTATHIFYAAADCTGHGVPGALVSVVCSNALSRCVKEFGLVLPGEILDKAKELVKETLEKSGEDVKDGMDISFLTKDLRDNSFYWAGANNPLWIIKKDAVRLTEIKPNKQPIGISENTGAFTTHALALQKGDHVYLFTDGYADQFGGEKGKKFKYKQLSEKLLEIREQLPEAQQRILEDCFHSWKGNLEQIDDVCIIGIRV